MKNIHNVILLGDIKPVKSSRINFRCNLSHKSSLSVIAADLGFEVSEYMRIVVEKIVSKDVAFLSLEKENTELKLNLAELQNKDFVPDEVIGDVEIVNDIDSNFELVSLININAFLNDSLLGLGAKVQGLENLVGDLGYHLHEAANCEVNNVSEFEAKLKEKDALVDSFRKNNSALVKKLLAYKNLPEFSNFETEDLIKEVAQLRTELKSKPFDFKIGDEVKVFKGRGKGFTGVVRYRRKDKNRHTYFVHNEDGKRSFRGSVLVKIK